MRSIVEKGEGYFGMGTDEGDSWVSGYVRTCVKLVNDESLTELHVRTMMNGSRDAGSVRILADASSNSRVTKESIKV